MMANSCNELLLCPKRGLSKLIGDFQVLSLWNDDASSLI